MKIQMLLAALCTIHSLSCMEKESPEKIEINKKIRKHHINADACDKANITGEKFFFQCIQNSINTQDKTILFAGCGTGNVNAYLAETAEHIHGFDVSKDRIKFAKDKYANIKKLSFECIKEKETKNFKSNTHYDVVITGSINNWRQDTKNILRALNKTLKMNGDFFTIISTSDNPKPCAYIAGEQLIQNHISHRLTLEKLTNFSFLSYEKLIALFRKTGFKLITLKEQSYRETIHRDHLTSAARCLAEETPLAKYISDKKIESLLSEYVNLLIEQASSSDQDRNEYTFDMIFTTFHARKIKELPDKK